MWINTQDKLTALNGDHIVLLRANPATPGRHTLEAVMSTGQIVVLGYFDTVETIKNLINGLADHMNHHPVNVVLPGQGDNEE